MMIYMLRGFTFCLSAFVKFRICTFLAKKIYFIFVFFKDDFVWLQFFLNGKKIKRNENLDCIKSDTTDNLLKEEKLTNKIMFRNNDFFDKESSI